MSCVPMNFVLGILEAMSDILIEMVRAGKHPAVADDFIYNGDHRGGLRNFFPNYSMSKYLREFSSSAAMAKYPS